MTTNLVQGVPKKLSISFLAIKCVFLNVKLKVWYALASEDQLLTLYEKIGHQYLQILAIFANICQYLPIFPYFGQYWPNQKFGMFWNQHTQCNNHVKYVSIFLKIFLLRN